MLVPQLSIIFDVGFVIKRLQFTRIIKRVKSIVLVTDMVDKDDAVGVIDLVLDDTGEETFGLKANLVAIKVKSLDTDFRMAGDFAVDLLNAEAAFEIGDNFSLVFDNFRIDQGGEFASCFVVKVAADDDDALEAINLDTLSQRRQIGSKTMADVVLSAVTAFDPDLVVIDEMHKIKSVSSNASRLAGRIGSRVERRIGLTGTVIPHSPLDVYGQWRFLDPHAFGRVQPNGERRVATFKHFKEDYAEMGGYMGYEVVGFKNLDRLEEIMGERSSVAIKEECLDLPDAVDTVLPVALSPKELKAYEDMRTKLQVEFREEDDVREASPGGDAATAASRLVRMTRLRQITAGHLPDDEGQVREIGRSKAKTIASLIHDTLEDEKRIVAFGTFTRELAALEEEIADKRTTVLRIDGSTKPEDRLAMRQRFGSDDPARLVIVAQIKTLSVAVNELVTARNAIFASLPWQRDDIVQARDRLNRLGQKSATTFWYALAPNTVDDLVFQAYQDRTDLEKTLMNHIYADRK